MATAPLAEGRRVRITGTVQGVGFRPWVYRSAVESGVTGRVWNDSSGVTIEAFGAESALRAFGLALRGRTPPAARIADIAECAIPHESLLTFSIVTSATSPARHVSIPPDLATCDACVDDIFTPGNRRYRYPFTNCTNCGPRLTIATDAPYDRSTTTMAPFAMCDACRTEYEDVADRRFHAQPVACPECGPRLTLVRCGDSNWVPPLVDVVDEAAHALVDGLVVSVKGIGGFHLACDATSESAVQRLRARKHRDEKPLAVMVRTIEVADALADFGPAHRELLLSPERPIVLVDKRPGNLLAPSIAPGNRQIGLMLPYSPLHHLLLADVGRPLVMTSGNRSDEPIAFTNEDALARLGGIADLIVLHDRDIHTRCDDSVAAVVAGAPALIRRSRGYVPRAIDLHRPVSSPVLATGAALKNTFCLASGTQAFLGPHIGDLENLETYDSFTTAIERFQQFVDIRPEIIACDAHPDYMSTMYAEACRQPVIAVQHHHAHVVSAMAEHGLDGPVIGLAYDGTGYGFDGTSWGGEVLWATPAQFERLATFRPIALVGGDAAVHEPWRAALALVLDAWDGILPEQAMSLMASVTPDEQQRMASLIRAGVQVSLARGIGRYFDAFGALFLDRRRAAFEGQVALQWNQVAEPSVTREYPFSIDESRSPMEVDLRPSLRAAIGERQAGVSVAEIAAAFHNTLAAATAAVVVRAAGQTGHLTVVASGGCFQNARLAESIQSALGHFDIRFHQCVPAGDGGIALGQVVVASARAGLGV
ncbi:MAG: carbamoyltransferase HypF [Vicinamibacterales bacterium]